MWISRAAFAASLVLLLAFVDAGCTHLEARTSNSRQTAPATRQAAVTITDFAFVPMTLVVQPGTTITWTNADPIEHTVTSGTPGRAVGPLQGVLPGRGSVYRFRLDDVGEYRYFCDQHHAMTGLIVVRDN